jgi:hypothetical protein
MIDPITNSTVSPDPTPDPVSQEIDAVFGGGPEDIDGKGPMPTGDKTSDGVTAEPETDYTGLSSDQLARMFQSKYDKTKVELDKAQQKLQMNTGLEDFIEKVYEDPEVRHAFLAEIAPDLVKPKDPYSVIEERLKKEFGQDFTPDDEEAKKPLSPTWKYYRRVDQLMTEIEKNQAKIPSSLKELRDQRKRQRDEAMLAAEQERAKVLAEMKWQDQDFQQFSEWARKLNTKDLAKIYRYTRARSGARPRDISTIPGVGSPQPNVNMADLNKFFG